MALRRAEIPLTLTQLVELRAFSSSEPQHPDVRPNDNLIRRNLLMRVDGRGPGWYVITELGRAALAERRPERAPLPDDV